MIISQALFRLSEELPFEEFAVTILHELLHAFEGVTADYSATSEAEAKHDLMTYALLGLGISRDHWAFKKYPHILADMEAADAEQG